MIMRETSHWWYHHNRLSFFSCSVGVKGKKLLFTSSFIVKILVTLSFHWEVLCDNLMTKRIFTMIMSEKFIQGLKTLGNMATY